MPENDWNPALYDQKHAFIFEYGRGLLSILAPQAGEHILDLGCGTGHLTQAIAASGAHVVGFDSSPEMIKQARTAYPSIEFLVADARTFSFPYQFDAIFSNAALHWIPEAERVVEHIAAALYPGGRLVAEFGGKGNVASITNALQKAIREIAGVEVKSSWYFPSIGLYTSLLEQHGLEVQSAVLFDRPTILEEGQWGLRNWLIMFCENMLAGLSADVKQNVIEHVEIELRPTFFKEGSWYADYRRLRIRAVKEKNKKLQEEA